MKKTIKKFLKNASRVALSVFMFANFLVSVASAVERNKDVDITAAAASTKSVGRNTPLNAQSLARSETKYVKDVKFITGESLEDAKKYVPEGYILVETDLNQGAEVVTSVDDVYLAYTTTDNPDEAITDIKMMNMEGGYVISHYNAVPEELSANIQNMVAEFKAAVEAFAKNYKKGTYGAKAAYYTLSAFTVDEFDNKTLADLFVYSQLSDGFYLKLLMNAHIDVLSSILSALTMAVQGETGDTWLDRLAQVEDPYDIGEDYWAQAQALLPHFESFYETYDTIDHDFYRGPGGPLYNPPDEEGNKGSEMGEEDAEANIDLNGAEFLYELAYYNLERYAFGDGSLISEWLVSIDLYEEMLYPLIEVLTPAEYAMMHLCGPMYMILGTTMNEAAYNEYMQEAAAVTQEMGGKCSVWTGIDTNLLRSSIGITDRATQAICETKAEQQFNDQGDSDMDTMLKTAGAFAAIGAVALGVGMLTLTFFGSSLFAGLVGTSAVLVSCKAAVVASIAGTICAAVGVVGVVVALAMAIFYAFVQLFDWISGYFPDYTEIPEYMYDYVIDSSDNGQFLLYEAAKDQNGDPVDVNAFEGYQWHIPYVSRDKSAGAPIKADFIVRLGDGRVDEGYGALSAFGKIDCENLNKHAQDDEVGGIYVSYLQEDLSGDYARGKYLSDAKLFTAENEEQCKIKLKKENYVLYNVNLTPDADYCTYLGYKTTNKKANALTDMRFAYGYNSTQYSAGGGTLTYAASGSAGDLTLYITRVSLFGSPITSDFTVVNDRKDAPAGYEPVNMFSGGAAVNMNVGMWKYVNEKKPYYLYFLPSKVYVSGTEYIGGLATMFDVSWEGNFNDENSMSKAAVMEMDYKILTTMQGKGNDTNKVEGAILYSTTYNPYRAIYGVGAMANGGSMGNYFSETITYDGIGYMLATRYVVDYNNRILFDSPIRKNDVRLYVIGARQNATPLTPNDITATPKKDMSLEEEGYTPVNAFLLGDSKGVDISKAFNYSYNYGYNMNKVMKMTMSPIYLFVRGTAYKEASALTSLTIVSKEQLTGGKDINCENIDNSAVMSKLASQGAHTVIDKNLNLKDSDNATYLGYTKDVNVRNPITDLLLYYAGDTNEEPKKEYTKGKIKYQLVGDANIFCEENYDTKQCKRVYLYSTTNPAAGDPILDITIDDTAIINGLQTVRTQNGKALYDEMDEYAGKMWFIHMKRATPEPKYIGEIVVGWGSDAEAKAMLLAAGCDYMLAKDLNDGVGVHSDYVYLGYKRTSDATKAIRDIISVHDEDYATFTKNGSTYHKVDGNLNSWTNIFADDIYLFYTKDSKAGTPITALGTSDTVANWSHGDGNRYVVKTVLNQKGKASDLNDGAGGDYIYLLQTRDREDSGLVASMIGKGSVLIIIAFTAVSACVVEGIYIAKKKRRCKECHNTDTQSNVGE